MKNINKHRNGLAYVQHVMSLYWELLDENKRLLRDFKMKILQSNKAKLQ